MKIRFSTKGDYNQTQKLLRKASKNYLSSVQKILDKYGQLGVDRLREATPVDTGLTRDSWGYTTTVRDGYISLVFFNDNENKHVNIAWILQKGHATRTHGWVEGRDYINPALDPIFKAFADDIWKVLIKY